MRARPACWKNMVNRGWRTFLLVRSAINIIRKDWREYNRPLLLLTAGMFLSALASRRWDEFSHGMMAGILIASAYSFASFCFAIERQRGTLQLLLALPVRPSQVVLAKYASLYSMALFVA